MSLNKLNNSLKKQIRMTNIEAVKALIGSNYPYDEGLFESGLTMSCLDPNAIFEAGKTTDIAFADFILFLTTSASRISEGGYTVEINIDALFRVRNILLNRWGVSTNEGAVLIDKTYTW